VWNGRFLTAAHVLPQFIGLDDEPSVLALSRAFEFQIIESGVSAEDEAFRSAAADGRLSFQMVSCDWAVGSTDHQLLEVRSKSVSVYAGNLRHGSPVSLVRASSDGRTIQRFDTRVVIPEDPGSFPENLVFLAKPKGFDHHGWSGCFVGQEARGGRGWKLIGVLSASPTATNTTTNEPVELLVVVRQPIEALRWLLEDETAPEVNATR